MQNTKSGPQIIFDFFLRGLSATAGIYVLIGFIAIVRVIVQDIPASAFESDDPFLVAYFLSIWCIIPAIPASIAQFIKNKRSRFVTYWVVSAIQVSCLYVAGYLMSLDPESEVGSSALPLLIWVTLPLAALYYPLFFYGRAINITRNLMIVVGMSLALYGHW